MIKVIVYTVCFLAVVGLSLYGINKIYQYGWTGGWNKSEKIWREKQVEAQEGKIHAIKTLRDSMRAQAIDFGNKVTKLDERNVEDKANAEWAKESLIDSIMSGDIRLYLPTAARPDNGTDSGGRGVEKGTDITTGGCPDQTSGELHASSTAFLFRLTTEADELADKHNYLIDYIKLIRASCAAQFPD